MTNMNGAGARGPHRILNTCKDVDRAIDAIDKELVQLGFLQSRYLNAASPEEAQKMRGNIDGLRESIQGEYRALKDRVVALKRDPESGNPQNAPQVGKVDRKLKTTINKSLQLERDFRQKIQEQIGRTIRNIHPDATDAEIQQAAENPDANYYANAVSCIV